MMNSNCDTFSQAKQEFGRSVMNFNSPHHSEDRLTENFENIITKQADVKTPALFPIGLIDPDANTKTQK